MKINILFTSICNLNILCILNFEIYVHAYLNNIHTKTWTTEMRIFFKKTHLAFSNGICCQCENCYGRQQRTCWYNDKKKIWFNKLLNHQIGQLNS